MKGQALGAAFDVHTGLAHVNHHGLHVLPAAHCHDLDWCHAFIQ